MPANFISIYAKNDCRQMELSRTNESIIEEVSLNSSKYFAPVLLSCTVSAMGLAIVQTTCVFGISNLGVLSWNRDNVFSENFSLAPAPLYLHGYSLPSWNW